MEVKLKGLAVLWILLVAGVTQLGGFYSLEAQKKCGYIDIDVEPNAVCEKCDTEEDHEKWLELILRQRAEIPQTDECFNEFPLGSHSAFVCPRDLTKGNPVPDLDLTDVPRGYLLHNLPFFRYNTPLWEDSGNCSTSCPESCYLKPKPDVMEQQKRMDIGNVKKYYDNTELPEDEFKLNHNVDVQILEWPGRTNIENVEHLEAKVKIECAEKFYKPNPTLCLNQDEKRYKILRFERDSTKRLEYPCNKQEGTSIFALGLMTHSLEPETPDRPNSKFYLSYGEQTMFLKNEQPLYIPELILNEMAKTGEDAISEGVCLTADLEPTNCDFTQDYNDTDTSVCFRRMKFFSDRGDVHFHTKGSQCNDTGFNNTMPGCEACGQDRLVRSLTGDLRTVLDFTFVQGRLILGMRCGVLVLKDFLKRDLNIKAASLVTKHGIHKNTFSPVSKISSSHCCESHNTGIRHEREECPKTIIAAYSSYGRRAVFSSKEIYVSFDLGDKFETKLMTEPISALNLMWGMHRMYEEWYPYYEILQNSTEVDIFDEFGNEIHEGLYNLTQQQKWGSMSAEEREDAFVKLYNESAVYQQKDLDQIRRHYERYIKLRTEGVNRWFVRQPDVEHSARKADISPDWLVEELSARREAAGWKRGKWTDSNCDNIPECRAKFINDPAVSYFLNQSDIIIKTAKPAVEGPFCDQIVSLDVLEEEESLYVLCVVGFGDFSKGWQNNETYKPGVPGEELSCHSRPRISEEEPTECWYPRNKRAQKFLKDKTRGPTRYETNDCLSYLKYYAVFTVSVREKSPLVLVEERRSERLFTCPEFNVPYDSLNCRATDSQPELVRIPNSIQILIKNCKNVLYYSPNGGATMYHTRFFAHQDLYPYDDTPDHIECQSDFGFCRPPVGGPAEDQQKRNESQANKRQLMYRLKPLDRPPIIGFSVHVRNVVFMTMGKYYAYGVLGINEDFTMIVGEILPKPETGTNTTNDTVISTTTPEGGVPLSSTTEGGVRIQQKTREGEEPPTLPGNDTEPPTLPGNDTEPPTPPVHENIIDAMESSNSLDFALPAFTNTGRPFFAIVLRLIHSHNEKMACHLYAARDGLRLVPMDMFKYKDQAYYYSENRDLDSDARTEDLYEKPCHTFSFSATPGYLSLDVGEKGRVEVTSFDMNPKIHLGLVSSDEKSTLVQVDYVDRNHNEMRNHAHDWDVTVTAIRNFKSREEALVQSFYGVENSNLHGFFTEISLGASAQVRCHVQPSATVSIHMSCNNKRIAAHEDEYRPQCFKGDFSKNAYIYKLEKGNFNPDLAAYWIQQDKKEKKGLIKLTADGDLEITYDYLQFGCPLEPYKTKPFIPDLRIVSAENNYNTSYGKPYEGKFFVFELFGVEPGKNTYKFERNYSRLSQEPGEEDGCTWTPIPLNYLIETWVRRKRMFRIARNKQNSSVDIARLHDAQTLEEIKAMESGNWLFHEDAVDHPINIVNRVIYRDCRQWRSLYLKSENITEAEYLVSAGNNRDDLEIPLQILRRAEKGIKELKINHIKFQTKSSTPIYIFMAVGLDPAESLCEYYTIFAVHIPTSKEAPIFIIILVFLGFLLLWLLMFLCGFWCRRSRLRTLCISLERRKRLEEAAWKVVYQYERLLQENENSRFEEELDEKDSHRRSEEDLERPAVVQPDRLTRKPLPEDELHLPKRMTRVTVPALEREK